MEEAFIIIIILRKVVQFHSLYSPILGKISHFKIISCPISAQILKKK